MFRYFTLLGLAGMLLANPSLAQSLYGTFTAAGQSSGVPIALNLSVIGGQISGVMGTGQPGANPPVVNPASMVTRVQGTAMGSQWVVQAGAFTMRGVFNGSTYSGTYTVGGQGGVFSMSTSAPVYRAPVAAAPAYRAPVATAPTPARAVAPKPTVTMPPVAARPVAPRAATPAPSPTTAKGLVSWLTAPSATAPAPIRAPAQQPVAAAAAPMASEYLKGSQYYSGAQGTVVAQLVINLSFNGNSISGTMGIGSTIGGATITGALTPTVPLQGTRNGQNCTVTTTGNFGGTTYTGVCTATSFSGIYRAGGQSGNFSVTTTGQVPAQVAVIPTPAKAAAPVPARLPVAQAGATTCPASGTAPQLYRGTLYGQAQESIAFSLTFNGGRILGSMGMAMLGAAAPTPNPVSGTLNGQQCTLTAGGMMSGAVFAGTCNGQSFNGTYNAQGVPMQFMTTLAPGSANAVSTACNAPAPTPAHPPAVPVATTPTSPTITYCGRLSGPEFGATIEMVRITMSPTGQGIGSMVIGNNLPGSGSISESVNGGYCYGTTPGIEFTAICAPTTIAGFFDNTVAAGQGHFEASTAACTNAMATLPAPFLKIPVAPVPPKPVQAVVTPPAPTPVPPVPVPQPKPAPAPKPVTYCGFFDDVSVGVEGSYTVTLDPGSSLSGPGTTFSGTFTMGQLFTTVTYNEEWGDGHFTGTRNGNQCSGQTDSGQTTFSSSNVLDGTGACTATVFNVAYVATPQNGTITTSTAKCTQ
jgi:hypothetical protein